MFHEDRDIVAILKSENSHFERLFDKHNSLNDRVDQEGEHMNDMEAEVLKKEKLKLKDTLYAMIVDYKKNSSS